MWVGGDGAAVVWEGYQGYLGLAGGCHVAELDGVGGFGAWARGLGQVGLELQPYQL